MNSAIASPSLPPPQDIQSSGAVGIPKVVKQKTTQIKAFNLSTSNRKPRVPKDADKENVTTTKNVTKPTTKVANKPVLQKSVALKSVDKTTAAKVEKKAVNEKKKLQTIEKKTKTAEIKPKSAEVKAKATAKSKIETKPKVETKTKAETKPKIETKSKTDTKSKIEVKSKVMSKAKATESKNKVDPKTIRPKVPEATKTKSKAPVSKPKAKPLIPRTTTEKQLQEKLDEQIVLNKKLQEELEVYKKKVQELEEKQKVLPVEERSKEENVQPAVEEKPKVEAAAVEENVNTTAQ